MNVHNLSSEIIDDINIHQSSIKTPKRLSDMNGMKSNQFLTANKIAARLSVEPKDSSVPQGPSTSLSNTKNTQSGYPSLSNNQNPRKETKYMEISFSNDNNSNHEVIDTKPTDIA